MRKRYKYRPKLQKVRDKRLPKNQLLVYFYNNGYIRSPVSKQKVLSEYIDYKKGWETRFVVRTKEELHSLRKLLSKTGVEPKNPFKKGNRIVQPVYGRSFIEWLFKKN